jgi:hypothetical protein
MMKTERFPVTVSEEGVSAKIRKYSRLKNGKTYTIQMARAIWHDLTARKVFAFQAAQFTLPIPAIIASGKSRSIRSRKSFPAQILASALTRA